MGLPAESKRFDPVAEAIGFAAGGPLSPEAEAWLRDGLSKYLRGDDKHLETCLSLSGSRQLMKRDEHLQTAADLLLPGGSPWPQAKALLAALDRLARMNTQLANLPPAYQALRDAMATGRNIPRSDRRLADILAARR